MLNGSLSSADADRVSAGIPGLDEVLHGGFLRGRTYLISGPPGTGKTTLGWHFLAAAEADEPALFITFGEPETDLRANAAALGFDTAGIAFVDLSPSSELFESTQAYDIFSPAEVEREPTNRRIAEAVERVRPRRVFIDSMTHLRFLSPEGFHFRRHALSFLRYLADRGAAVLMTSESTREESDDDLRFISDGVIELALGDRVRSLTVSKFRGSDFRGGVHSLSLGRGGATVFPRLVPESHSRPFENDLVTAGIPLLDGLLHGGLERGTVTLITGPSGVGKTTLGVQFLKEAAARGERSVVYTFDERAETLLRRCAAVNIPVREMVRRETLQVVEIEALRFGPDEFANLVRRDVEDHRTQIVMIDSISGYRTSISGEDLTERLHALAKYLSNVGVTVMLINELQDLSAFHISDIGISYLADNVLFLRYIERRAPDGIALGKGIGVLKKRLSDFEKSMREFAITASGVAIGEPLYVTGILAPIAIDERRRPS